ncbi:hypothetical protein ZWY2020_030068 [Hordeum vulgare]|nr:hypothetical protein ZWY2020_030068 [Hordeum vulgare]
MPRPRLSRPSPVPLFPAAGMPRSLQLSTPAPSQPQRLPDHHLPLLPPPRRDSPFLTPMAAASVLPISGGRSIDERKAATQAWEAVMGWIGFLLQVLLQILRGTPSCAQLLSFVGFR